MKKKKTIKKIYIIDANIHTQVKKRKKKKKKKKKKNQ